MQGSPNDLAKSGVDFAELVGTIEKAENEESPDRPMSRQVSRKSSTRSLSSMSLNNSSIDGSLFDENTENDEEDQDNGVQMEASSKGKFKGSVATNYFTSGAHWSILVLLLISFVIVQLLASAADIWVSVW